MGVLLCRLLRWSTEITLLRAPYICRLGWRTKQFIFISKKRSAFEKSNSLLLHDIRYHWYVGLVSSHPRKVTRDEGGLMLIWEVRWFSLMQLKQTLCRIRKKYALVLIEFGRNQRVIKISTLLVLVLLIASDRSWILWFIGRAGVFIFILLNGIIPLNIYLSRRRHTSSSLIKSLLQVVWRRLWTLP